MKLPHGRRAHDGARPAWWARSAWRWMPAFRRRYQQGVATLPGDLSAAGRRITGPYAEAVEQLSSDKAQVRRDGLSALERFAQDNPAHRQAIVDVICAYLRMPFSATAPARRPEPGAAHSPHGDGAERAARADGVGGTWHQERQVRLAAQRILSKHLRDDRAKDQQPTEPPSTCFWADIRLDLTSATLIDFNLVNGVTADANFHRATFSGGASFGGATFAGAARFGGATFAGAARFGEATFSRGAQFGEAAFSRSAQFRRTIFSGAARFGGATFTGDVSFGGAIFAGAARFGGAIFAGAARFGGATFTGDAQFAEATFSRGAGFRKAAFGGGAGFRGAAFGGDAWFEKATFSRGASFDRASFSGETWFDRVTFTENTGFDGAAFSRGVWFGGVVFGGDAGFGETAFGGDAWFDKATFGRGASFDEAAFTGDAGFDKVTFTGGAWFGEATFGSGADALHFRHARILSPGAAHVWPTGWRLTDVNGGGYAVVRAAEGGS